MQGFLSSGTLGFYCTKNNYETIKRFKMLNNRLLESKGEITPSQKIKPKVVRERYKEEIEELYR